MADYVQDVIQVSSQQLIFSTKNMYLPDDFKKIFIWIFLGILVFPFVFFGLLFLSVFLNISNTMSMVITLGLPFGSLLLLLVISINNSSKKACIELGFIRPKGLLSANLNDHREARPIKNPQYIRVVIRYYAFYPRSRQKRKLIVICVEIVGESAKPCKTDQEFLSVASISCHRVEDAVSLLTGVLENYRFIAEWLNIPIQKESNSVFIRSSEKQKSWISLIG